MPVDFQAQSLIYLLAQFVEESVTHQDLALMVLIEVVAELVRDLVVVLEALEAQVMVAAGSVVPEKKDR